MPQASGLIAGILTILFVILKIFGAIKWSWIWVISPLWIAFAGNIAFAIFVMLVSILVSFTSRKKD